jgi:archaellum biogenesis ATPase FlaH
LDTNDFWDIPLVPDAKPERKERQPGEPSGDGTLAKLYQKHPEGGGPYGGRDNAITAYVGYLRSTGLDYYSGLGAATLFNDTWLDPPLEQYAIAEKVGRAWADWSEGVRELVTQQMLASELMSDKLKALEVKEEPELEIWDWWRFKEEGMNCEDEEWIAENMIIHKGLHFIAAASGSGKSWLGIDLAIACASGRPWCHFIETAQTKVLYINEEIETRKFWGRFCMMHPTDIPDLHIIQKKNTKVDKPLHMNKIVRYVKEHQIKLVVVDTFVRIHSMDENDNGAVAKLYDRFQEIIDAGAAVVVLHHNKKLAPGTAITQDTMRGASDLAAQADMVLSIYHDIEAKTYDVRTVKHRHIGEDDWVHFVYKLNSEQPGQIAIEQIANAGTESDVLDRIVQFVSDNPGKTKSAICAGIKKGRNLVWDTISDAVTLQLIECREGKYYRR